MTEEKKTESIIPTFEITDSNNIVVLKKLCNFLSEHRVVATNRPPVPHRYPHFVGAEKASIRAAVLDEFIAAKVVLVSPGVAVLSDTVLSQGKMLVSPTPGLREEKVLQQLVKNDQAETIKTDGKRRQKFRRLELNEDAKIDVLVVGSMLVDKTGRRMGKKWEQVGLEFVLGGLPSQNLIVITLVHDCQVVEELPGEFFSPMDVPVDIIITPSRVIRVKDRLPKPRSILWDKVTEGMLEEIPVLKAARNKDKEAGKNVELAPNGTEGWKREHDTRSEKKGYLVMGSKIKLMKLPKEFKYAELRDVLKGKVDPGFKIGVLKFGMAVVYFKENSKEVMEKLRGLEVEGAIVDLYELEFVVRESKAAKGKGAFKEVKAAEETKVVKEKKVEMKSKFKFENIGNDVKSVELKKALTARGVHFGFLKIFKKSNIAIVLFRESGSEVEGKIEGLVLGEQKLVIEEVELGEKRDRQVSPTTSAHKLKSSRKADKLLRLEEMNSKFKFRNLGHMKVAKLKESLRERKVEPGFMVVYKRFGNAIVLFKEMSSVMEKKLKGLKVDKSKVVFEEVVFESKRITRSKSLSEGDKKEEKPKTVHRKRTASQKFYEKGLSGIFIGSLPRGVTAKEVKEAVGKKQVNAAHVELIGRKGIAFAYFDKKPEDEDLLNKLKDLRIKEHACKVEVMRTPPRNSRPVNDANQVPKVKGIVAKEKKPSEVEASPISPSEKPKGTKKSPTSKTEVRSKKSSSSEGEEKNTQVKGDVIKKKERTPKKSNK